MAARDESEAQSPLILGCFGHAGQTRSKSGSEEKSYERRGRSVTCGHAGVASSPRGMEAEQEATAECSTTRTREADKKCSVTRRVWLASDVVFLALTSPIENCAGRAMCRDFNGVTPSPPAGFHARQPHVEVGAVACISEGSIAKTKKRGKKNLKSKNLHQGSWAC